MKKITPARGFFSHRRIARIILRLCHHAAAPSPRLLTRSLDIGLGNALLVLLLKPACLELRTRGTTGAHLGSIGSGDRLFLQKPCGGYNPGYPRRKTWAPPSRDGPAHKFKTHGAGHCLACTTRLQGGILTIKIDLIGYARYHIACNLYRITN
jgi:hypothetical protein